MSGGYSTFLLCLTVIALLAYFSCCSSRRAFDFQPPCFVGGGSIYDNIYVFFAQALLGILHLEDLVESFHLIFVQHVATFAWFTVLNKVLWCIMKL